MPRPLLLQLPRLICLEHSSCLSLPKQKDKQGMQKAPGTRELALENPAHA
ncbi:mCG6393, partial [Mus musculus]